VYSRIINGEEHTFGVSGKLIRNVLVMYDRETNTLWSQLLGEAVAGPLESTRLEFLPAVMTTWEDWREMHPDTLAIVKGYFGNQDPYFSYYYSESAGVIGSTNFDDRLGTKEFVIGVDVDEEAVAFPFSVLNEEPVVNYEISELALVVSFDPQTGAGAVWERTLADGSTLEFASMGESMMRDLETGSLWDGLSGQAVSGDLEGEILTRVKSTQSFWFGWVDFHPDTELYGLDE
jgi:hypothetical protein